MHYHSLPGFQSAKLLDDVEQEGFFPHRKGFDVPKRNREFIECFREYLQKQ